MLLGTNSIEGTEVGKRGHLFAKSKYEFVTFSVCVY